MKMVKIRTPVFRDSTIIIQAIDKLKELRDFVEFCIKKEDIEQYGDKNAVIEWQIKSEGGKITVRHYLYILHDNNIEKLECYDAFFDNPKDTVWVLGLIFEKLVSLIS